MSTQVALAPHLDHAPKSLKVPWESWMHQYMPTMPPSWAPSTSNPNPPLSLHPSIQAKKLWRGLWHHEHSLNGVIYPHDMTYQAHASGAKEALAPSWHQLSVLVITISLQNCTRQPVTASCETLGFRAWGPGLWAVGPIG